MNSASQNKVHHCLAHLNVQSIQMTDFSPSVQTSISRAKFILCSLSTVSTLSLRDKPKFSLTLIQCKTVVTYGKKVEYIYIYSFIQRKNSETNIYAIQKQSWSLGVVFSENDVLKYFVKFTRKHLCQSLKVFKNFFLEHLRTAAYSSQKHIENPVKHQREAFCRNC